MASRGTLNVALGEVMRASPGAFGGVLARLPMRVHSARVLLLLLS